MTPAKKKYNKLLHGSLGTGAKYLGHILVLGSILFLAFKYFSIDADQQKNLNLPEISIVALASLLFLLTNTIAVSAWLYLTNNLHSPKISFGTAYKIWMQSNVGKYLPGNIFHYVGRFTLSHQEGIKGGSTLISIFGEIALLTIAAILLALLSILTGKFSLTEIFPRAYSLPNGFFATGLTCIAVVLIIFCFTKTNKKPLNAKSLFTDLESSFKSVATLSFFPLCCYFLIFILAGYTAQLVVTSGWTISTNLSAATLISAYAISFIVGFLIPGAPGGLGVREFTLVSLLTPTIGFADSFSLAVALRICSVIADFLGALTSILIPKAKTGKE